MLVAELADGIAGLRQARAAVADPGRRPRPRDQGAAGRPRYRGRGVGRALIDAAIEQAERDGVRKLTLRVLGHNAPARALYAACGFEVEGVPRELFFLDGGYVDDVLMALDLTTPRR